MNSTKKYDVIVVGSGGGTKLVRPVAAQGKRVAIIEKDGLGGTCLNRGCIPSKMLIHAADVASMLTEAPKFDVNIEGQITTNMSRLVERVAAEINAESESIAPAYEANENIDLYRGEARFVEEKVLEVNGERLSAEHIFLPVGSRPFIPNIPGLEGTPYMDSTAALRNTQQPKKLLVVGGGFISAELGYFYAGMGSEVHLLVRDIMLRVEDDDVREEFCKGFSKHIPVHYHAVPTQVTYKDGLFTIECEDGRSFEGDGLLVATGVRPNSDTLNLSATGVKTDAKGHILVDEYLATSCPGIYAFGDVIGRYLFRHTSNFEGEYLFKNLFEAEQAQPIRYPPIPAAVFSHPQIGSVGARESDLQRDGIDYIVGKNSYSASAMGMALRSEYGFAKLLFGKADRKLLGAHVVGDEASNMVHMLIAYMQMGATLDDILDTIFIHPALPEIVRNAARKARSAFEEGA